MLEAKAVSEPATGAPWTPDERRSPGRAQSLDAPCAYRRHARHLEAEVIPAEGSHVGSTTEYGATPGLLSTSRAGDAEDRATRSSLAFCRSPC